MATLMMLLDTGCLSFVNTRWHSAVCLRTIDAFLCAFKAGPLPALECHWAIVDHPGVWEDSRDGYMHEALIRRRGHPSTLAVLYAEGHPSSLAVLYAEVCYNGHLTQTFPALHPLNMFSCGCLGQCTPAPWLSCTQRRAARKRGRSGTLGVLYTMVCSTGHQAQRHGVHDAEAMKGHDA
eukprot:scaffold23987_cov22-Tisochrysis_lutea.AAC.2